MIGSLFGGGSVDPVQVSTEGYYYGEGAPTQASRRQLEGIRRGRRQIQKIPRYVRKRINRNRERTRRDLDRSERIVRGLTSPYRGAGDAAVRGLQDLVTPEGMRNYVQRNPFFDELRDDAARTLFANEAARGKVGTGGTARALDNAFALLGENLVQSQYGRLSNLAGVGERANRLMQGTIDRNAALRNQGDLSRLGLDTSTFDRSKRTLADLYTDMGDVRASGIMGEANARIARDQAALQAQLFNAMAQQQADIANSQGGGIGGLLGPIMKIAGGAFGGPAGAATGGALSGGAGAGFF